MSAPTKLLPASLVTELPRVLARLHTAREVDPQHDERLASLLRRKPGSVHIDCDVCTAENRLNVLIERLPRLDADARA